MLVIARKLREVGPLAAPQQSDYAQDKWVHAPAAAAGEPAASLRGRQRVVRQLVQWGLIDAMRAGRERWRVVRNSGLDLPQPDYQRVDVHSLVNRTSTR